MSNWVEHVFGESNGTGPDPHNPPRLTAGNVDANGNTFIDVSVVPALPELPDLDEMISVAEQRREHFSRVAEHALAEVERADAFIAKLGGRRSVASWQRTISEATYLKVLAALGNHAYAGVNTLCGASGMSDSTVGYAMQLGVEREHVKREKRGQRYRYTLLEAGQEYLTAPVEHLTAAQHEAQS